MIQVKPFSMEERPELNHKVGTYGLDGRLIKPSESNK
jgi:hypothetical protein